MVKQVGVREEKYAGSGGHVLFALLVQDPKMLELSLLKMCLNLGKTTTLIQKDTSTAMFITALFTIAKT